MKKQELQEKLDIITELYNTEKQKNEEFEKMKTQIEEYKELNLCLQLELKQEQKNSKSLEEQNQLLASRNRTFEEVFVLLKVKQ